MVVIDASVAFKWLVYEEAVLTEIAQTLLSQFLQGKERLIAPDILLYELANILASKAALSSTKVRKSWDQFTIYKLPVVAPTEDFIKKSINFSKKYNVSVYDASYAVLAKEKGCKLITADKKFAEKINLPFIKLIKEYK